MTAGAAPGAQAGSRPDLLWIDAATPSDVDAVVELEKLCYPEPWSRRQFRGALDGTANQKTLALRQGKDRRVIGYLVLQVVVDELHVHNLAIDPRHRRSGLARRLLAAGLRYAERRGTRQTFLEVRRGNEAALALYRSFGFEQIGVRKGYYARPREDALVLRRPSQVDH